ncbi:MAG: GDP-mannose 4,6-dehydratase [Deltaproteobacteria bacterium]|nr:GDP-mannose 4,6-dehydratase [Deltaproteobacteria bacterium]
MRVFVTGARGFVGGHLVPRLVDEGFEVTATDLDLDVTDATAVAGRLKLAQPEAIIHLASQSSVAASAVDPESTHSVNYGGARSVLEGALRCGSRPRILLIGSAEEYGSSSPDSPPLTEDAPLAPASAYARSKAEAEALGTEFAEQGLDVVRVRAFGHTGPGQSDTFVLSNFARQTAEIEAGRRAPVLRVGNLASVRDFLDVDDVVEAYLRLLDPDVPADIYNVASGVGTPLRELLDALLGLAKQRPLIECDPERVRPADYLVGDASRLRTATGWAPSVPIERMLERVLDDWRRKISES